MKIIATLLAAFALMFGGLVGPAQAATSEPDVAQFCVDFTDAGEFSPHLAEDYSTWERMRGHRVASFVNTAQGCSGLDADAGTVWDEPNPFPEPCPEPVVTTVVREVVRTVADPAQAARIERQARKLERKTATIKRLRAKIRGLR